jgi:hypothetical protein
MKLPLQRRGVIATTAGALPRADIDPEFERLIDDFMAEHLPFLPAARRP